MRRSDGGRLFYMDGAATENARWPRLKWSVFNEIVAQMAK